MFDWRGSKKYWTMFYFCFINFLVSCLSFLLFSRFLRTFFRSPVYFCTRICILFYFLLDLIECWAFQRSSNRLIQWYTVTRLLSYVIICDAFSMVNSIVCLCVCSVLPWWLMELSTWWKLMDSNSNWQMAFQLSFIAHEWLYREIDRFIIFHSPSPPPLLRIINIQF